MRFPAPRVFEFVVFACLAVAGLFAAEKEPLAAVDDKWRHIRSPHFELYTHNAEYESRSLLHDMELLRALFLDRFKFVERSRLDVTVFSFRRAADFNAYAM